jgi:hypothetical protein
MDPFDRLRAGGQVDVRVQGLGVYAVILADIKFQNIGKESKTG